jgi:hypothetical protein
MAVADLLMQAATTLEKTVSVYFYNETQVSRKVSPTEGDEQTTALREFTATRKSTADGVVGSHTQPLGLRPLLPQSERVAAYLRLLRRMLGRGYRSAGIYKAIQEATTVHHENALIILTDLETNVDALIEATHSQQATKILVSQIGATWRLSPNPERGYAEYQRNAAILKRLRGQGVRVFDARPEELLEILVSNLSSMLTVTSYRE